MITLWREDQLQALKERIEDRAFWVRKIHTPHLRQKQQDELTLLLIVRRDIEKVTFEGETFGLQRRRLTPEQRIWAHWLYWTLAACANTAVYGHWKPAVATQLAESAAFTARLMQERDEALAALTHRQQNNAGAAAPRGTYGTL